MGRNGNGAPVESIPGIGIIRARALRKAGWPTVESLAEAGIADLTAVPGITEIKAAQIMEYIRSLPPAKPVRKRSAGKTVETPPVTATPQPPAESISITFTAPPEEEQAAVEGVQSVRDLIQDVALSAQLLLTSEFAAKWEREFTSQLGKLISLHEKWDRFEPVGKKQSKLAMELLQKVYRLLTETPIEELTKRKSQQRFAEIIRDRRRKVRDIVDR
jgi:hypothetical protein